jgi:hypothetical protein
LYAYESAEKAKLSFCVMSSQAQIETNQEVEVEEDPMISGSQGDVIRKHDGLLF